MKLTAKQASGLTAFWAIHWAALCLAPARQRDARALMADAGLVERKGPLRLTKDGDRILRKFKSAK